MYNCNICTANLRVVDLLYKSTKTEVVSMVEHLVTIPLSEICYILCNILLVSTSKKQQMLLHVANYRASNDLGKNLQHLSPCYLHSQTWNHFTFIAYLQFRTAYKKPTYVRTQVAVKVDKLTFRRPLFMY